MDAGAKERSYARRGANCLVKVWRILVPVLDNITDYWLLWNTFDEDEQVLWWICLVALFMADVDRVYALVYLIVLVITLMLSLPLTCMRGMQCSSSFWSEFKEVVEEDFHLMWKPADFLSGGQRHTSENIPRLFLDAACWIIRGPRSLYAYPELGGEDPMEGAYLAGSRLRIIDRFLEYHLYTLVGHCIFLCPNCLWVPRSRKERSRRAMVMVKAVGETLVVDPLFLALGIRTTDWNDPSLAALFSSIFSVAELLTELQHYINETEPYLEEYGRVEESVSGPPRVQEWAEPRSRRSIQIATA